MAASLKRPARQTEIRAFRREALIRGVLNSIADHGMAGTTVETIAEAAGVSRGLLGHYFKSKDHLLVESYRHLAENWAEEVGRQARAAGRDADLRLKAMAEALMTPPVYEKRILAAYLAFWNAARNSKPIRLVNRRYNSNYRKTIARLFARAAKEKGIEIDAEDAAIGLLAIFDGLWLSLAVDPKSYAPARAIKVCHTFIDRMLGAAGADSARPSTGKG